MGTSGVCEAGEHDDCRMLDCECRCHSHELYRDRLSRAILGDRYLEIPSIRRGWPRR